MFLKVRVIDGEYIVKISRSVVKHVYKVNSYKGTFDLGELNINMKMYTNTKSDSTPA